MARPSRETVYKQFSEAEAEKVEAWTKRNPPPAPPTEADILAEIKAGKFKMAEKCSCTRRSFDYKYSAPDKGNFDLNKLIEVRCVADFCKRAHEYKVKRDAFMRRLTKTRNGFQNPVLFGKASFPDAITDFIETYIE
jgi:hypothetical protein